MIELKEIGVVVNVVALIILANILFWWLYTQTVKIEFVKQDAVIKALNSSLQEIQNKLTEISEDTDERIEELERQQADINEVILIEKH